jgi:O-antigen/teichoic acid export membrane protein
VTAPLSQRAGHAVRWRIAQLVGVNVIFLIRVLVLAKILAPDAFGLLAIALVPIGVLLQATELGMIPALVHSEAPARRDYDVAWSIGFVRGLLTFALVVLVAPWVAELAGEPRAADITRALALHPLLIAASSIRLADLQRRLEFRPLAILHLGEAIANTVISIALAPHFGAWSLVAGTLAGSLGRLSISYLVAPYAPRFAFERAAARGLIRFGRWIFVAALLSAIGAAVLRLLISRQVGVAELGVYYLATRLTFLLAGTVIDVGTSVSFPIYARLKEDRDEAVRVFRAVWSATTVLIVPAFALLIALAPTLVSDVLGAHWSGTAPVLRVLALVTILSIFGDVSGPLWHGMGQPWRNALIEAVQSAVLLLGVWWLTARIGVIGAALAWIPAVCATQILTATFLPRVLPRPMAGLSRLALAVMTASAAGAALAIWVDGLVQGLVGAIGAGLLGGGLCLVMLWLADRRLELGLERSLATVFPRLSNRGPAARGGGG